MGRPFETELSNLARTARAINALSIDDLAKQIDRAGAHFVFLVGTGGSLTSAEFARCLFNQRNVIATTITPLEFIQSQFCLTDAAVFIFSAGGNNKDILASFQAARDRDAAQIVIVCATKNTKLGRMAIDCEQAFLKEFSLPCGRDGYLATNSLFATALLLARTFGIPNWPENKINNLLQEGRTCFNTVYEQQKSKYFVILFSNWSKPAAIDLESKLSEAGLFASMLADYRHFAHGRHNWLDKRGEDTTIVAFSNPEDDRLASATLSKISRSIPVCHFSSTSANFSGAMESLLKVFGFIAAAGHATNIDPGRPKIPQFGSKIYQIGPKIKITKSPPEISVAAGVERKRIAAKVSQNIEPILNSHAIDFLNRLRAASFGGLVIDFDGTILPISTRTGPIPIAIKHALTRLLNAHIPIYFATGRGDSIHTVLTESFPKKLWPYLNVGYLNGAFCLSLSDIEQFSQQKTDFDEIDQLGESLLSDPIIKQLVNVKNKHCQISIFPKDGANIKTVTTLLQEKLAKLADQHLRMVMSSHSIDLIPIRVSKTNCVQLARQNLKNHTDVLAIGDCGAYPGNDFELLGHPFSLSVGSVSADLSSCWNFLPRGLRHTQGTAFYLSKLVIRKNLFKFNP